MDKNSLIRTDALSNQQQKVNYCLEKVDISIA